MLYEHAEPDVGLEMQTAKPLVSVAVQSKDLKPYDQSEVVIVQYEVETDCSLEEFLTTKGLTFKRGCVLCEFNKVEAITEDMLVLFAMVNIKSLAYN